MKNQIRTLLLFAVHAQAQMFDPAGGERPAGVNFKLEWPSKRAQTHNTGHTISVDPVEEAPPWPQHLGPGVQLSIGRVFLTTESLGAFCIDQGRVINFPLKGQIPEAELDTSKLKRPLCCFTVDTPDRIKEIPPFKITLGAPLTENERPGSGPCWRGVLARVPVYSIADARAADERKKIPNVTFQGFSCIAPTLIQLNGKARSGVRLASGDEIKAALRRPDGEILNRAVSVSR